MPKNSDDSQAASRIGARIAPGRTRQGQEEVGEFCIRTYRADRRRIEATMPMTPIATVMIVAIRPMDIEMRDP